MVAPLPLTDQRVVNSPAGSACALKRITSPVRAVVAPLVTERLRRLFFTTVTVVVAVPEPAVAVIVALPGPTPVTTPPAATVATRGLSDVQSIGTPVRGLPPTMRVTASSCALPPTTSGLLIALISTVLMLGGFTMNVVKPALPPTIEPPVT